MPNNNRVNTLRKLYYSLTGETDKDQKDKMHEYKRKLSDCCGWRTEKTFYIKLAENYIPTESEKLVANSIFTELQKR